MAVYTCRRCSYESTEPWEGFCPGCNGPYRTRQFGGGNSDHSGHATLGSKGTKAQQPYISTGQEGFDYVMGGGLVAGRTVLIGGYAGAGKTRILLTIADYIGKTQGMVIYASGEESVDDVSGIGASLGLVNDRVIILGNQSTVEGVIALAKKVRAFLIFFDSAQEFITEQAGGTAGSISQLKAIGAVIKRYCGDTKTCAIVVNQMTGEGGLKGGTELEHKFDTVNVLCYPKDDDEDAPGFEDDGVRMLINANKNRGGVANRKSYWRMTEAGVLEHIPAKSKLKFSR
jgi:DNA repair protein RadA/Sms